MWKALCLFFLCRARCPYAANLLYCTYRSGRLHKPYETRKGDGGMKKPQIRRVIAHVVRDEHTEALSDRIAALHVQVIEHSLNRLELTIQQKQTVIDLILANLKTGEKQSDRNPDCHHLHST